MRASNERPYGFAAFIKFVLAYNFCLYLRSQGYPYKYTFTFI